MPSTSPTPTPSPSSIPTPPPPPPPPPPAYDPDEHEDPHARIFTTLLHGDAPVDTFKLRRAARARIPDHARAAVWKLLLGIMSPDDIHDSALRMRRSAHYSVVSAAAEEEHVIDDGLTRKIRRALTKLKLHGDSGGVGRLGGGGGGGRQNLYNNGNNNSNNNSYVQHHVLHHHQQQQQQQQQQQRNQKSHHLHHYAKHNQYSNHDQQQLQQEHIEQLQQQQLCHLCGNFISSDNITRHRSKLEVEPPPSSQTQLHPQSSSLVTVTPSSTTTAVPNSCTCTPPSTRVPESTSSKPKTHTVLNGSSSVKHVTRYGRPSLSFPLSLSGHGRGHGHMLYASHLRYHHHHQHHQNNSTLITTASNNNNINNNNNNNMSSASSSCSTSSSCSNSSTSSSSSSSGAQSPKQRHAKPTTTTTPTPTPTSTSTLTPPLTPTPKPTSASTTSSVTVAIHARVLGAVLVQQRYGYGDAAGTDPDIDINTASSQQEEGKMIYDDDLVRLSAIFLHVMDNDEGEAYVAMNKFLTLTGHGKLFLENGHALHDAVSTFLALLRTRHLDVYDHLVNEEVDVHRWARGWLRGLLVSNLTLPCVLRLWDFYLSHGGDMLALHPFVCLVFVSAVKIDLCECDEAERIHAVLSKLPSVDIDQVVAHAMALRDETCQ